MSLLVLNQRKQHRHHARTTNQVAGNQATIAVLQVSRAGARLASQVRHVVTVLARVVVLAVVTKVIVPMTAAHVARLAIVNQSIG